MLMEQQSPALALQDYEASMKATPNRLRALLRCRQAAELRNKEKAAGYFNKLARLTRKLRRDAAESARQARIATR